MPDKPQQRYRYQNAIMDSAKWDHYNPRPDDIIITTSYKAGTTWMQAICAALVFQRARPPVPQDALSPWFDSNFAPIDVVKQQIEGLESRRYLKTHCPLDAIRFFEEVKYIFVGRDGRDVFMSMWNHWNNLHPDVIAALNNAPDRRGQIIPEPPQSLNAAFDDWLSRGSCYWEEDGYPFWSHLRHAQTWWDFRHLPNILFVHFNDLLDDTDAQMRRIAEFLDIPVDEEIWPELLKGVSFSALKNNAEWMAPGATHGAWKDNSRFFDKGTNQRWRGVLTDQQSDHYRQISSERMEQSLDGWLANGGSVELS